MIQQNSYTSFIRDDCTGFESSCFSANEKARGVIELWLSDRDMYTRVARQKFEGTFSAISDKVNYSFKINGERVYIPLLRTLSWACRGVLNASV